MFPQHILELNDLEKNEVSKILEENQYKKQNLISILQSIQEIYDYLPSNIIYFISEELKISPAEIYGVATFYTQFKLHPKGKNVIICCEGTACHVKGSPLILSYLENELGIKSGETTKNGLFSLESVACLGCCAISPVMVINNQIHGNLTLKKVNKIISQLRNEIEKGK
ncbi:MAG: NADH-quinone oxidoreductase subunit NuoE [Candidatus Lokiarchaeota archaeon]|nr:NADH-quinone oxidoreductase subunit NuoE [Candidatus Lokiarchaeota archaeon]